MLKLCYGEKAMKKVTVGLFLITLSIMLTLFSYGKVSAQELDTEVIYPNNIVDYTDLTNISSFDINNNYIAYTLDKQNVVLFEKSTRKYTVFSNFSNISKIKLTSNSIIVVDDNVYIIKNFNKDNIITLDINISDAKAIDVYTDENNVLIGLVNSTSFKLYKYNLEFVATSPVQTITPSTDSLAQAFTMSINNKNAYIVCNTSPSEDPYTTSLCKIDHTSNTNNAQIFTDFQSNVKVIESFVWQGQEYLCTFTSEILFLLPSDNDKLANNAVLAQIDNSTQGNLENSTFPIFKITDLKFYNNKLYLSDSKYKTIQSVSIDIQDDTYSIKSDEIILGSASFDKGRFNQATDIYIQGNTYTVSDSANNRIHILKDNTSSFINLPNNVNTPKCLTIDSKQNIYVAVTVDSKIQIWVYSFSSGNYTHTQTFETFDSTYITSVSDMCVDNNDNVYILGNNQILYLSGNRLIAMENINIPAGSINSDSQIAYISKQNLLAISTNNKVYFLNTDGNIHAQQDVSNLKEITADVDKLYAITNNNIYTISFENDNTNLTNNALDTSNYAHFSFDIIKRKMLAFNLNRSCLTYINFGLQNEAFTFDDIASLDVINNSSTLTPLKLNNTLIYKYPYELGDIYNIDGAITYAIGISKYDNYYRILFENDNKLEIGFVRIANVTKIDYKYNTINVITTNQTVPLYKYPTLLTYNGNRLIIDNFDINSKLTLIYKFPISIDGKTFYTYQNGNTIGFIFEADIVLYSNKTITNLNTENASIHLIGKENTSLLAKDLTTKIKTLKDSDRIYVENYDKNNQYTKVIIKDINLNTYEGYVLTSDIKMDKLDNSKIILIVIIIISIVILALIVTSYIVIKKKNK